MDLDILKATIKYCKKDIKKALNMLQFHFATSSQDRYNLWKMPETQKSVNGEVDGSHTLRESTLQGLEIISQASDAFSQLEILHNVNSKFTENIMEDNDENNIIPLNYSCTENVAATVESSLARINSQLSIFYTPPTEPIISNNQWY